MDKNSKHSIRVPELPYTGNEFPDPSSQEVIFLSNRLRPIQYKFRVNDEEKAKRLFEELEFKSLIKKLPGIEEQKEEEKQIKLL